MHIEHTIKTVTTPDDLWILLTEPDQIKRWIPELVSDEPTTPGPAGLGTRTRMRLREGSKVGEYATEITVFEPSEHLELRMTGGNLGAGPMVVDYRLMTRKDGTTLRYTSTWRPQGLLLRLLSPLITYISKKKTRSQLERLRSIADS